MIAVIMGSTSDLPTMQGAIDTLKRFDVAHEVKIVSAHRTPELMRDFSINAKARGFKVIIAGAGGAAHLPGMTAAWTTLPVIGVPVSHGVLQGQDALLSIVQMPRGVPVACVAIDNSTNAAMLALRMLASFDEALSAKLLREQLEVAERIYQQSAT